MSAMSSMSAVAKHGFYGGIGGGSDLGNIGNRWVSAKANVANIAVVAVENRWILSHLQRLVLVKVQMGKIMTFNILGRRKNPHPNPSSPRSQVPSGESP
jgi:hypothetical protein